MEESELPVLVKLVISWTVGHWGGGTKGVVTASKEVAVACTPGVNGVVDEASDEILKRTIRDDLWYQRYENWHPKDSRNVSRSERNWNGTIDVEIDSGHDELSHASQVAVQHFSKAFHRKISGMEGVRAGASYSENRINSVMARLYYPLLWEMVRTRQSGSEADCDFRFLCIRCQVATSH